MIEKVIVGTYKDYGVYAYTKENAKALLRKHAYSREGLLRDAVECIDRGGTIDEYMASSGKRGVSDKVRENIFNDLKLLTSEEFYNANDIDTYVQATLSLASWYEIREVTEQA